MALIGDRPAPRSATVRCLTAVDVLSFTRGEFRALLAGYPPFRTQIEEDIRTRRLSTDGNGDAGQHGTAEPLEVTTTPSGAAL
jgi:CRP-like cAMP-binding protein